jgi:uncharacterized protein (TIGR02001 family)
MNINKYGSFVMRALLLIACAAVVGHAVAPTIGADIPFRSKYVWRGAEFNSDPVLWPDLWFYWNGFTLCGWASIDLTDVKQEAMEFTDIAVFADYTRAFGPVSATLGFAQYTYPGYAGAFPKTGELYAKLFGSMKVVQGMLSANIDLEEVNGYYISPSLSKSLSFGSVTPTLTLSAGYSDKKHNAYYYGFEKAGLADLTGTLKIAWTLPGSLGKYLALSGDISYSRILDSELAPPENGKIYGGIGLNAFFTP